jgi:hypothetical protein
MPLFANELPRKLGLGCSALQMRLSFSNISLPGELNLECSLMQVHMHVDGNLPP